MPVFKTEITSDVIPSDNPLHQRLLKPYVVVAEQVKGRLLELGCGEGRGVSYLAPRVDQYLGIDKIEAVIRRLQRAHPDIRFRKTVFPPLKDIQSDVYDVVVSFQVIEHVRNDRHFLEEIYRVLKPGGKAFITTPNIKLTLSRNPWHIREYTPDELRDLAGQIFDEVEMKGIGGNDRVMAYYESNKRSVERIMKYDIFNLQHRLPAVLLRIPYEILNRLNRNNLKSGDDQLVSSIRHEDYKVVDNADQALDLFGIFHKK